MTSGSSTWDEGGILELIRDQVPENLTLDYKRAAALDKSESKKAEISKDASAFANSAGGVLVYGVAEIDQVPTHIDGGVDPSDISREWLENVINSRIQPRIDGIVIHPIPLTISYPGRVIYVVSIPQSSRAPHMASDHRYYKRFNFQSVPMEDYEVRDVSRRRQAPDLYLKLSLNDSPVKLEFANVQSRSEPVRLNMIIGNTAPAPAQYAVARVYVDTRVHVSHTGGLVSIGHVALAVGDEQYPAEGLQKNWGMGQLPLWEDVPFALADGPLLLALPYGAGEYFLAWEAFSGHDSEEWASDSSHDGAVLELVA